ncbi:GntR family transcriptional regulator [Granulosicoccus sp. 3-233]|uniref:GntR family transcriptional regulator n=1 Tax=Granulosicoccus sp. 3-233 TaxID=3417969 RepID=UPI003D34F28D
MNAINRNPLHAQVAATMRDRIMQGELRPADRLNEIALCEELDISRTPLREAIKLLEAEGLVTIRPHKGAIVAEISMQEISEVFDLLAPLEALGIRLAMTRMSAEEKSRIIALHDRMIAFYESNDREGCFLTDYEFHNTLIAAARHDVLQSTHQSLSNRSQRGRYLAPRFDQQKLDIAMAAHQELIVAVKDDEIETAARLMHDHVLLTGKFVIDTLRASGVARE